MKKIVAITLCGTMLIGGGVYAREIGNTKPQNCIDLRQVEKDDPNLDLVPGGCIDLRHIKGDDPSIEGLEGCVDIRNPFIDCKTIEKAEKIAGFKFILPKKLPKGYKITEIQAIEKELIQVMYKKGDKEIFIRKGIGSEDLSGDYNVYKKGKNLKVDNIKVNTKEEKTKVKVATWLDKGYSFAILADDIDRKDLKNIVEEIVKNTKEGPTVRNPFIDCKTIEEAEKIAGLKYMKPSKLPEGYKLKTVEAVKDELIQVTYVNKKDQFIIRQARGKEDISGDYNKYTFKKEIGVNGEKVYIRGKDSRIKVANWTNGDYTFALVTENKSKGLKEKEFIKMLEGMIVAKYY